jgi:hypothetical protein
MGVITSRCEGISSLLYGMGYSSEILMKSIGYSYFISKGELVSLHGDVPPEDRGGAHTWKYRITTLSAFPLVRYGACSFT